jgi:plasmid maintenance system antidote protein VapI
MDRIIAIGDLLIERYLEQKEALAAGDRAQAIALQFEIKELVREKEAITKSAV